MVGPARIRPRPPGAGRAPKLVMVCWTCTPSLRLRPRPNHSVGQVGTPHPDSPSRSHHSPTGRSGSQFWSSQLFSSTIRSEFSPPPGAGVLAWAVSVMTRSPLDRGSNPLGTAQHVLTGGSSYTPGAKPSAEDRFELGRG